MRVVRVPISATARSASKSLGTCGIQAVSMPAPSAHSISASILLTLRAESPRSAPIITPRRTDPPKVSLSISDNVLAKKENANTARLTSEDASAAAENLAMRDGQPAVLGDRPVPPRRGDLVEF